jgi:hypothetical protein
MKDEMKSNVENMNEIAHGSPKCREEMKGVERKEGVWAYTSHDVYEVICIPTTAWVGQ